MKKNNAGPYIICPKKKGNPKKHIAVCHGCRRKKNCEPYQSYIQPGLF